MNDIEFREILRNALDEKLIRQVDIVRSLRVAKPSVSQWVNGGSNPNPEHRDGVLRLIDEARKSRYVPTQSAPQPSQIQENRSPYPSLSTDIRTLFELSSRIHAETIQFGVLQDSIESEIFKNVKNELLTKGMRPKDDKEIPPRLSDFEMLAPDGTEWGVEIKVMQASQHTKLPPCEKPLLLIVAHIHPSDPLEYYTVALSPADTQSSLKVWLIQSLISGGSVLLIGDTYRYPLETIKGVNLPSSLTDS